MDAFDKHIKSLFENHEAPVDTQELWQNVEPRLGKPRRIGRILVLLLLLIGLPVSYLLLTQPGTQQPLAIAESPDNLSYFGRKGQLIDISTVADTPKTVNEPIKKKLFNNSNSQSLHSSRINQFNGSLAEASSKDITEAQKENDARAESLVTTQNSSESFEKLKPRIIHSTKKVATNTGIQPVISLDQNPIQDFRVAKAINHPFKWSFDLFGGGDYAAKQLKAKAYDYNWYSRERKETEKYMEAFNLGFHFNLEHQSGFFGGTGLVYHHVNELFESKNSTQILSFREGVVQIVTYADGSSTEVTGQKLVIENKSWNKKKYNNYGFLNVPVYMGWSHQLGMFRIYYSIGIDVNLHFTQKGEIIGKEGFPVSLSEPQNSIFRKQTSVNLNGGIKLLYPLSDRFLIYAEPNVHYNLNSITNPDYPLEQRYLFTGLRIGTRMKF